MKVFYCNHCAQPVFFENIRCLNCGHDLAYLPDREDMASLEPLGDGGWYAPREAADDATRYRLCANYQRENVCNWAIPDQDSHPLCQSCRLTRTIPDLSRPGAKEAWYRMEVAKRRLIYSLSALRLPLANRDDDSEHGLAYEFLAAPEDPEAPPVLTGHADGVITINIAEADDAEREKRRVGLGEPYRTLLGHFRHESGHYYWDRLVRDDTQVLERCRALFGDERTDYGEALKQHYQNGAPQDWPTRFISAYAASHPWEDWAESWAHYLHMVDVTETASACGVALRPRTPADPALQADLQPEAGPPDDFERLLNAWFPLTYVLNNLNRGLGLPDAYPFVLSAPAIEKLRLIHDTVLTAARNQPSPAG